MFQSTHPYRVRLSLFYIFYKGEGFQSTHPYRVRHFEQHISSSRVCFNPRTHTGCDCALACFSSSTTVSIHAPIQGATSSSCLALRLNLVSIHAPIQGATVAPPSPALNSLCFNPRTHTGCDLKTT